MDGYVNHARDNPFMTSTQRGKEARPEVDACGQGRGRSHYEDVYSPMKAAQQEHKHTDRYTNVKDRQRTELSKDIKTRIHVYKTKVFSLLKIQSKPTQHPVLTP